MNIQIFGIKKDSATRKAERWFKERNIPYQFRDLAEKGIAPRELDAVLRAVGQDDLLDTESKVYKDKGFAWMDFDVREEILEHPLLMKLPVIRNGNAATAGMAESTWKEWQAE